MTHKIISFESTCEGAGKTTQALDLTVYLQSRGIDANYIKFPFGDFRKLLLKDTDLAPLAQMYIFHADFNHTLERKIKPILNRGGWVVLDRYIDSTYAYQGYGHNLGLSIVDKSLEVAVGNYLPCKTLLLDIPEDISIQRLIARGEQQRLAENYGLDFSRKVRAGFNDLSQIFSHRIVKIPSVLDKHLVLGQIINVVNPIVGITN